jgi:hypothetical protein
MLNRLLGRHRKLRIGATIVGASALAVGFASPAFAAQSVNNGNADNANAQNNIVVMGGSNTTYLVMQDLSKIFNSATGCDLVGVSPNAQPLDYGCPGLNGEQGVTQPAALTHTYTVTIKAKKNKFTLSGANLTDLFPGNQITDSAGVIPVADPITAVNTTTGATTVEFKSTGNATSDTLTVNYDPQQGENGSVSWGNENPFNDVLVQEPAYGSGNGILELEGTGSSTVVGHSATTDDPAGVGPVNVSPLDAARSSRAPSLKAGGDFQGLNFVAYAEDAVSYNYWVDDNATGTSEAAKTDAARCIDYIDSQAPFSMSTAQLKMIWNETYSGGVPSVTWQSLDPGAPTSACPNNPVYAYWTQSGSGTESTWAGATGASFPGASSNWPSRQIIFENETSAILGNADKAPISDVISFFSYGAFSTKCTPNLTVPTTTYNPSTSKYLQSSNKACTGTSTTSTPNSLQLGTVWDDAARTTASGLPNLTPTGINNQLPGLEGAIFKGDRLIYNVYADGQNPNLPESSPATLNAISEDGFLCKPSTTTDIDGLTGETYRTEIDAALAANGFLPLPQLQVEDGQGDSSGGYGSTSSGINTPAWNGTNGLKNSKYNAANETGAPWNFAAANVDTDNSAIQGTYSAEDGSSTPTTVTASPTAPVGFCITETTDFSPGGQ